MVTCCSKSLLRLMLSSSSNIKIPCLAVSDAPCEQGTHRNLEVMMVRRQKIKIAFKVFCQDITVEEGDGLLLSWFTNFV